MLTSAVQRERLVSPFSLSLMAVAFGVAFYVLVPHSDLSGKSDDDVSDVDDLQLAYLKAQRHAGKATDTDVIRVIQALASSGRADQAYDLLLENPGLPIGEVLRFEIDLGLAAEESDVSLYGALQTLVAKPQLHQSALLQRAAELSKRLNILS